MAIHLKAARVNAGFTQEEVVKELRKKGCRISKNTLISYEAYRTVPDIETAVKMAELYNMSVDDIIFFAG
jgi:DNA-binding XRE family transcriptional regulator